MIPLLEAALKLCDSRLGPDHPDTLAARNNLAVAYQGVGRIADTVALRELTLKLAETKLGPRHPDTLVARGNLAAIYWRMRRLDRSVPLFEQTLRDEIALWGPEHPTVLITRANLGVNYRDAGRLPEAAVQMEEVLRGARGRADSEQEIAWVSAALLGIYQTLGRWDGSERLLSENLVRVRKTVPPDSPVLAASLAQLGLALLHERKWPEAEPVLRECLKIREAKLPDDWSRFNTASMLGEALIGQERYEEAEPLVVQGYEEMKARRSKIPPAAHPRLLEASERIVRLYDAWQKDEQAAAWRARLGDVLRELPADVFARP